MKTTDFACPKCHAQIGAPCTELRENGRHVPFHPERRLLAKEAHRKKTARTTTGRYVPDVPPKCGEEGSASGFEVAYSPVLDAEALRFANELECALGEIANGKRKASNIPMEPMVALIQFARDRASKAIFSDANGAPTSSACPSCNGAGAGKLLGTRCKDCFGTGIRATIANAGRRAHDPSWEAFKAWVDGKYSNPAEAMRVLNSYAWDLWQSLGDKADVDS